MKLLIIALACLSCTVRASDSGDTPDLTTILDTISKHADITSLLQYVKEYKTARYLFQEVIPVFPWIGTLLDTAAQKNAKLEVLLKVMKGEMPNVHDLYKLTTTKSGSIIDDIRNIKYSVPGWKKYQKLIYTRNILSTSTGAEQLIEMFSGKKVQLKSSLVQRMSSSDFKMAPGDDIASVNMMEFMHFLMKNYKPITFIGDGIVGLTHPTQTLTDFLKLDFSNLRKIVKATDLYHDGKYQVGSRNTKPDPEVVQLFKDLTSARALISNGRQASDKAQSLIMNITKEVFGIGANCLKSLEADQTQNRMRNPVV